MSGFGDYQDEMQRFRKLRDEDIESLLAGRLPRGDGEFDELTNFLVAIKNASVSAPDEALQERHLGAIVEASRVSTPDDATGELVPTRQRRKRMISSALAPLWAKVAAVTVGALLATGGLAAADVLPEPAQDTVAGVASRLGIDLPSSVGRGRANAGEENANGADAGKRVNEDVRSVLEQEHESGRAKGEAVSDAASQNRQDGNRPASPVSPPVPFEDDPTTFGPDNHPSGPPSGAGEGKPESVPQGNPTGYGPGNNPSGRP